MCSGVEPTAEIAGAAYVQLSISTVFGAIGPVFITVAMVLFAFTTLLGNLYYCDNCLTFILGKEPSKTFITAFRLICAFLIFLGAGMEMGAVWAIADILMAFMCFINLPACIVLSKTAIAACKDYEKQKKAGKNPVFHSADIGLDSSTLDCWK